MPSYRIVLILGFVLSGVLAEAGCSKSPAGTATSNTAKTAASAPAAMPAHVTAPPAAMPAHSAESPVSPAAVPSDGRATPVPAPAAGAAGTASGRVVETMDAAGYTYVLLDTGTEKIWAATAQIPVKVGQLLTVPLEMPMRNFHSDRLGRDFPLIYFASSVSRGGKIPAEVATGGSQVTPARPAMPPGHPPVGAGAAAAPIKVTEVIPPPPGGYSVADLWAQRSALAGKTVAVRGKVVKFLSGIMGRNWIHLQDGTGDLGAGTNDIAVTTEMEAKPGDVLTATGTLAVDKDFGAGYRYGAIIEGATVSK